MYQTIDLGRCSDLTDDDFLRAFETPTLEAGGFGHADHVRLAFIYLQRTGLLDALARVRRGLRRFAAHHGAPDKYHETVTLALVLLIHERMALRPLVTEWPAFAEEHPDLIRWKEGAFFDHYSEAVLTSEAARHAFVLPE